MSDIPKTYEAQKVEKALYRFWEEGGYFSAPEETEKTPFAIVMPPPNVTGVLHMGHALVSTLQDIVVRWRRMRGMEVLWVPGMDHAGIATQTVVERHLLKEEGVRRQELGRDAFLERVWAWKDKSHSRIVGQLKSMGCSCDWTRERFTMDEGCNAAVRRMFKKLFDEGVIYRGDYLVNWDPVTQTALADDEVEYEDRDGHLWHIRYPLTDGSGYVVVATTRPETLLGDTAVAVGSSDARYSEYVGKTISLPLTQREIPVITDHHVDPEFGSGVVKITPAHDPNDYQIGLRHNLPFVNMMTPDGRVNENGGRFEGMTMLEARSAVVEALKEQGLLERTEAHPHRVGVSYRSKATIEPYMSKQWFVRMTGFAGRLRAAVVERRVRLLPDHWQKTYLHWIDNLRDWCISRQLWWGHRIPIWYRKDDPETLICYDGEGVPEEVQKDPESWIQDEDVLDTWFSSALWPFSTLGWPEKKKEVSTYYPNGLLVTGHDILFFWVARMLMMGEHAMGDLPFPEVYLHGLIYGKSYWRDNPDGGITYCSEEERKAYDLGTPPPKDVKSKWEKMSKSKGNIIDPLEVIEEYGTDAVRMALCSSATHLPQIDLDRRRFEEFKNFANKMWNGARFVMMNLEASQDGQLAALDAQTLSQGLDTSLLTLEDRWMLSVLNRTVRDVNDKLRNYAFDQAAMEAYDFFWKEFCAFYVEIAKPVLMGRQGSAAERCNKQKLLVIVLCQALRLLHPMAPFITEELFQKLRHRLEGVSREASADPYTRDAVNALLSPACVVANYPDVIEEKDINPEINAAFALVEQAVYTIRNLRGEMKLPPSTATDVHLVGSSKDDSLNTLEENQGIIQALVRTQKIEVHKNGEPSLGFVSTGMIGTLKVVIPLPEELLERERARLDKEFTKLTQAVDKTRRQLQNKAFVEKAPVELIEKQKNLLEENERKLEEVNDKLQQLSPS